MAAMVTSQTCQMNSCNNVFEICPLDGKQICHLVSTGKTRPLGLAFICPECYSVNKDRPFIPFTEITDDVKLTTEIVKPRKTSNSCHMEACNNLIEICPVCDKPKHCLIKTGNADQEVVGLAMICPDCYVVNKDRLIQSTEIADGVSGYYTMCICPEWISFKDQYRNCESEGEELA